MKDRKSLKVVYVEKNGHHLKRVTFYVGEDVWVRIEVNGYKSGLYPSDMKEMSRFNDVKPESVRVVNEPMY